MNTQKGKRQVLQWHPAFYATVKIELETAAEDLLFESEHPLTRKPLQIDLVIIKKRDVPIEKNFCRIFRKYNIMEYKGVTDYLSIDDFYKVNGYACLYKALSEKEDAIKAEQISVSFVCHKYPRKLVKHLEKVRGYRVCMVEQGIYYIEGAMFVTQLVVTSQLSEGENLWMSSLTDELSQSKKERLIRAYGQNEKNYLYDTVMDIIVQANKTMFKEEEEMCNALEEIFMERWEKNRKETFENEVLPKVREALEKRVENELRETLESRVESELREMLESRVESELRETLESRVREEVKDEIRGEIKNEMKNEERIAMLNNLMKKLKLSFEEVCNLCDIPKEDRDIYREAIGC